MKNCKVYLFLLVCLLSIVYINCAPQSKKRYNRNQVEAGCTRRGRNRVTEEMEYYCIGTRRSQYSSAVDAIADCAYCEDFCDSAMDSIYRCT